MSYTKTNWRDGDVITASKMNKIEDGIENSLSEKLQALYKTMVGNDWPYENNPTDAEVIDKIAKDASGGGGGGESGGGWEPRFIDLNNLPAVTDFPSQWAKQYEAGLEPSDFYGAFINGNAVFGVGGSNDSESGSYFEIGFLEFDSIYAPRNGIFLYYPELGVIDGPEFLD